MIDPKMQLAEIIAGTYASLLSESPRRQNLLNAGFASVWYINDNKENVQENSVIKPLTKELLNSFCCIHTCY
jgi:hypothetical protein